MRKRRPRIAGGRYSNVRSYSHSRPSGVRLTAFGAKVAASDPRSIASSLRLRLVLRSGCPLRQPAVHASTRERVRPEASHVEPLPAPRAAKQTATNRHGGGPNEPEEPERP